MDKEYPFSMENNEDKRDVFLKDLKRKQLESNTVQLLHKTNKGKGLEAFYIIAGIASVFLYKNLGINLVFSLILGFLTYFFLSLIIEKIIAKTFRIDKQLDWFLNSPKGQEEIKKKRSF